VESWLGTTPLQLEDELRSKLREANVEVVETSDVPVAVFTYHEWQDYVRSPGGYGTGIDFGIEVTTPAGGQSIHHERGSVFRSEEPLSTLQLRERSIELLKMQPVFSLAGHVVGANLGLEASFRTLFADPWGRDIALLLVFDRLVWSPQNDDLFDQAILYIGLLRRSDTHRLDRYLEKQRLMMSGPAFQSSLSAITVLKGIGTASSILVLESIATSNTDPRLIDAAATAVEAIKARLANPADLRPQPFR
jgi:hypothetical protein